MTSIKLRFSWHAFCLGLLYLIAGTPNLILLFLESSPLGFTTRYTAAAASFSGLGLLYSAHRRRPKIATLALAIIALGATVEMAFVKQFGTMIDENALSLIAETNRAEMGDLIQALPSHTLIFPLLILLASIFILLSPRRPSPTGIHRLEWAAPIVLLVSILTLVAPATFNREPAPESTPQIPHQLVEGELALRSSFPIGLPWVFHDFLEQRKALKAAYARNKNFRFGATRKPANEHRKVFILVIGETSRADHWSVNGYARPTTPLLEKREHLLSFPTLFSFSTYSRLAVPVLISRKPAISNEQIFHEASLVRAFKESGFETTWISMQAPVGFHESPISVHAYEADKTIFMNPVDYRSSGKHDTAALPLIANLINTGTKDQFIVLHTLGSHFRYVDRYPSSTAHFLPDRPEHRKEGLYNLADKTVLTNSYDNSIRETDRLLDGLIAAIDTPKIEGWMFYSSDHGEALFDDCRNHSGHGQSSRATHHVASVFWPNETFRTTNALLVKTMTENAQKNLATSMGFATLSSLGGLVVPGNQPTLDITSPLAKTPREIERLNLSAPECK